MLTTLRRLSHCVLPTTHRHRLLSSVLPPATCAEWRRPLGGLPTQVPTCCQTEKNFKEAGIVPVALPVAPRGSMNVHFCSGACVSGGNTLTPTQTLTRPRVRWMAGAFETYTLAMIDLDAPSRKDPSSSQWLHWLVVNVPGDQVHKGQVLAEYIGSAPLKGTEKHRYVLLAYKQFGWIRFNEPLLCHNSDKGRANFNVCCFALKYNLNDPVAGNYYRAAYDESVPGIYRMLGYSG